jgi:hypothetical protein
LKKSKLAIVGTVLFVAAVSGVVIGIKLLIPTLWEKALMGPYRGTEVANSEIPQVVPSKLPISETGKTLLLYEDPKRAGPILALQARDGEVIWAQMLITSDATNTLRNVHLISVRKTRSGYKLRISCHWGMGDEAGIVYLGQDLSFQHFSLSW